MKTIILFLFAALTLQAETDYKIIEIRKDLDKGVVVRANITVQVTIDGVSNIETSPIPKADVLDASKLKICLAKAMAQAEKNLENSQDQTKIEKIDPSIISITPEDVATEKSKL